ncbi:hypothetical protein BA768_11040 [Chryseobacterium sp. CBo1]|uniref:ribosomal protein L7/L12 n=2 Tax=Chryseobacterium TaxID=59732 RepID=UPI000810386A|nr:ribosomal protein L7/L12 [Chryseobacterium sp. CBo1]OCK52647.1 hypothetical protein BA768_11040 [Chryseobacterium sp. CBo1]
MTDDEILLQKHNILTSVQELIQRNEMISAIKLVKDKTGLGLKESKDLVDNISRFPFSSAQNFNHVSSVSTNEILQKNNIGEEINTLLQQNKKLEAIKLLIDNTGMGLHNAKNFVESIQNKETTFNPEAIENFSNISVKMTNINGKITVKMKEGSNPGKIIYPNDPNWEKAKKMLGNKPELLQYETEFLNGKHPIPQKKSNLFVETNSFGKWILFFVLFCLIMLVIYFFSSNN